MNVSGLTQYSKATSGMRSPKKLKDQDFKLVFVYPLLLADKIPNYSQIETLLRDFLSITFLKEIFIENAINIVSMANQIRPITDESGRQVEPFSVIAQVIAQQGGDKNFYQYGESSSPPNYTISSGYKHEIEQKIKEKTAIIHKYTQTDPILSKLKPYIEMITMGNLIDVPVIIGTKSWQLDTLTLLHVLIAAVSLKDLLPGGLSKKENIDIICGELSRLDKKSYWALLSNLSNKQPSKPIREFFWKTLKLENAWRRLGASTARAFPVAAKHVRTVGGVAKKYLSTQPSGEFNEDDTFAILRTIKQNLNQVKLFFNFCLDPNLLKSQTGLSVESEESLRSNSTTEGIIPKEASAAAQKTIIGFNGLIKTIGNTMLNSALTTIQPYPTPRGVDQIVLINKYINNQLSQNISDETETFFGTILDSISQLPYEQIKLSILKSKEFCNIDVKFDKQKKLEQIYSGFDAGTFHDFLKQLEDATSEATGEIKLLEQMIQRFVNVDAIQNQLRNIRGIIDNNIKQLFDEFTFGYDFQIGLNGQPICVPYLAVVQNVTGNNTQLDPNLIQQEIIPTYQKYITSCFYFYFLVAIRDSICNKGGLLGTVDIQIDNITHEVTDFPNYSLVLPLEIVLALHAAIVSGGWNELIHTTDNNELRIKTEEEMGRTNVVTLNENYVKGIVKFIAMRLDVPNLFVVDTKKGDIYYKMMQHSSINKTKINTINTFIKSSIDKPITQYNNY